MDELDDLAILVGLLGNESEQNDAEGMLRRDYLRNVVAYLAHLCPYVGEKEICRAAELVLAEFVAAVQRGAVQDDAALRATLVKESRRQAAILSGGSLSTHPEAMSQAVRADWKSKQPVRSALANLPEQSKLVLRALVRSKNPNSDDRTILDALAQQGDILTVVEVKQARQNLTNALKEVIRNSD
jgi:hypothetical protein